MEIDYFETGLLFFCDDAKRTLWEIERFNVLTEESWKRKDSELQDDLSQRLKNIPEKHHDEYIASYGEDLHENQMLFPSIHRFSIIISIHSYLEDILNQLAKTLELSVENPTRYQSYKNKFRGKGSVVQCAYSYVKEVASLDLSAVSSDWIEIQKINKLRNQLVHEAGFLPSDESAELNEYVELNEHLSGKPGSKLVVHAGFIEHYLSSALSLINGLDEEINELMRR